MGKKYMAILLALCVVLTGFAACEKTYKHGIKIKDNKGEAFVLATDDHGKTITDEAGNIAILVTEEDGSPSTDINGNQATNFQSPPDYYTVGDTVECDEFSIGIPRGWELSESASITLKHKSTGGDLSLMVKDGQALDKVGKSVDDLMGQIHKKDAGSDYTITTINLFGVKAAKYQYKSTKNDIEMDCYVFTKNKSVFLLRTDNKIKYKNKIDFEAVMNTIKFK